MTQVLAWGATAAGAPLTPMTIARRSPGPHDVVLDILFCGVCHSDIHQARDEWSGATFPMVPGHEIVGRVVEVGRAVTKLTVGELGGVGCMVDACRTCGPCAGELEQFCAQGPAFTYNSTEMDRRTPTFGGYSARIVVDERFALKVPASLDPAGAAPLLCAGITTYAPLKRFGVKAGQQVGVVGLGGLGHMAVKLARSMGAGVTVLSTTAAKEADARRLGATDFVVTRGAGLERLTGKLDLVIDTVSAPHAFDPLLACVRPGGAVVLVGVPPAAIGVQPFSLIGGNKILAGSMIGGIRETQEMLDHCAAHGIVSDIEIIPIQDINAAYARVLASDVRYRFVIELASLRS